MEIWKCSFNITALQGDECEAIQHGNWWIGAGNGDTVPLSVHKGADLLQY